MKKLFIISLFMIVYSLIIAQATELFISEYIEGSSYNKAIEIFNGTGAAVDLSEYSLKKDVNGNDDFSTSMDLSGNLEDGEVYVICHPSADEAIQNVADLTNGSVINFNGDDQVRLYKDDVVLDHLGESGDVNWAQNVTLVRHSYVASPNPDYDAGEWESYPQNTFDYIGYHIFDGGTDPIIIVTSPNGGEQWEQGSTQNITWTSANFEGNVKIELEMIDRTREVLVASTENDGVWEWNIPEDQALDDWYVIIISDAADGDPWDQSNNPFSIIEPIPVTPYTIYEIQYTEDPSGDSPHLDERISTTGVVTATFSNGYYIQDGAGAWNGINVYPQDESVSIGDDIYLEATVFEYQNKTELIDVTNLQINGIADLPEPTQILTGQISMPDTYNPESWEGVLVRMMEVTVTNEDLGYGEWEIDDGIDTSAPCRVDDLGDYSYLPVLNDFIYSITGIVDYGYGDFKLQPRNDDDINITGLDVSPQRLLFLTYDDCFNGKEFSITNLSETDISISYITSEGEFPCGDGVWWIEDFNLEFPYDLEAGNSLNFNVIVDLPVYDREISPDTLYIETEVGQKKVTLLFNSDLNNNVDDNTITSSNISLNNHPNPFRSSTTISFSVTQMSPFVTLDIYNIKGQKVKTLDCINHVNAKATESLYSITWNGTDENNKPVSNGIYFYQLKSGKSVSTRKMILMR
ncbi:MAG TPA: T9SS type A sorting domain-containing protein [Candidatus Cloacimonetes bacterium]|nr:T9SS type A sorting domain-containing protein [Candidatus Cloacimonadota bacterium]